LNGLHDVMAAAQVDRHPGLPAFAAMLKVRHSDKAQCDRMRGMTCVSDAAQQLVELAHTHHMATTFLESKEWFVRLGKYRDTLPIVRTRPDVTFRTEVNERVSGAMPVVSFRPLDPLSSLLDDMAKGCGADRRCFFGYRGPWSGGWGDIAYAAHSETIETIVSNLAHLADILSRPPRPLMLTSGDSAVFDARGRSHNLTFSWMTGQYSAEMVLAHYLQGLEIVPFFWRACHVGRHRLRASSEGVSRVVLHVCN